MDAHLTLGNWLVRLRRGRRGGCRLQAGAVPQARRRDRPRQPGPPLPGARQQKDALDALEVFRTALRANPKNPQSWYQLATLYLDTRAAWPRRRRRSRTRWPRTRRWAPPTTGSASIAFTRGDLGRGGGSGAARGSRWSRASAPRTTTWAGSARRAATRGQAEALYREELATYPDNGRARFNLAQIRRARGDREGYLAELREGVEKAPDFGACYWYLAREELGAGRLEEAADLAQRGLEAQPVSDVAPLGHYVLADVYNRQGQAAKAQEEVGKAQRLEAALRKNPAPRHLIPSPRRGHDG